MKKRGVTLVEQMIAVSLIGLSAAGIDAMCAHTERAALGELQRARAEVLLDYAAGRAASGRSVEPEVLLRLASSLPDAQVERVAQGDVITLTATWRAPVGVNGRRSVTVLGAKP